MAINVRGVMLLISPTAMSSASAFLAFATVPVTPELVSAARHRVPVFPFTLLLFFSLPFTLSFKPLLFQLFLCLLNAYLWFLQVYWEAWVSSILARLPFWTEPSQVEWTQLIFLIMFQRAVWAKRAKSAIVMGAGRTLRLGIDVKVKAVVAVGACQRAGIIGTLRHATEVVLVQEFARLALLAESAEPVFADKAKFTVSSYTRILKKGHLSITHLL